MKQSKGELRGQISALEQRGFRIKSFADGTAKATKYFHGLRETHYLVPGQRSCRWLDIVDPRKIDRFASEVYKVRDRILTVNRRFHADRPEIAAKIKRDGFSVRDGYTDPGTRWLRENNDLVKAVLVHDPQGRQGHILRLGYKTVDEFDSYLNLMRAIAMLFDSAERSGRKPGRDITPEEQAKIIKLHRVHKNQKQIALEVLIKGRRVEFTDRKLAAAIQTVRRVLKDKGLIPSKK